MGAFLPGAGPLGRGTQCGSQPLLFRRGLHSCDNPRAPLPLLPASMWLSLHTLHCIESALLVFKSFSKIVALYVVGFCVSVGGGKPRIFLLHHLDPLLKITHYL